MLLEADLSIYYIYYKYLLHHIGNHLSNTYHLIASDVLLTLEH